MLRTMLEDRFKVSVHRGMKEVPVYELTLSTGGPKLAPPRMEDPKRVYINLVPDENNEIVVNLVGNKASMDDFTHVIEPVTHTPVLNRTGLKDDYSFDVKFAVIEPFSGVLSNLVGATGPSGLPLLAPLPLHDSQKPSPFQPGITPILSTLPKVIENK